MKRILNFFFIYFFLLPNIFSQPSNERAFDSIFNETAIKLSTSNPTLARHIADSLFHHSMDAKQKLRSLMLIADIHAKQEQYSDAIEHAKNALILSEEIKDYSFQARIYGFLATQYRLVGFTSKAKEYLQNVIDVTQKIQNKNQATKILAMAYHEMADYEMDADNFKAAREYLNLTILSYEQEENPRVRNLTIANALELMGRSYMAEGNPDAALPLFIEAKNRLEDADALNTLNAAIVYKDLAKFYVEQNQLEESYPYLQKALSIAKDETHLTISIDVYKTANEYFKAANNMDSLRFYSEKIKTAEHAQKHQSRKIINQEFERHQIADARPTAVEKNQVLVYVIIIISILLIISYFSYIKVWKKRELITPVILEKTTSSNAPDISADTRNILLERLKEFESKHGYLNPKLSFSSLVDELKTNATYLRIILKEYREDKDFNTYLNDLRIKYILQKLQEDQEFRHYKISYLAKISGFSSHSNFSANFKRVTDLAPSEYIISLS